MKKVNVKIDGTDYTIVGEKNEEDIVTIAKYIDEKIAEIKDKAPSLSRVSSTVLASVNIVAELLDSKKHISQLELEIQNLKKGYNHTTENVEKEFDNVLDKLDIAEKNYAELDKAMKDMKEEHLKSVENYEKAIKEKEDEISRLKSNSVTNTVNNDQNLAKIQSLELKLKDMEKKVIVAESMATEFQNKAYNLQLNLEELRNKEGNNNE